MNLGSISGACGDNAEAAACLRRAIELNPKTPPAVYVELGQAMAVLGERDAAIQALDWAVKHEPTPRSLVLLGELLQQVGRQQEGAATAASCGRIGSRFCRGARRARCGDAARGPARRGRGVLSQGDLARAGIAQAYNNLGQVLNLRQKWPEAIVVLNCAVELQPDLASAYHLLGDAFRGLDRPEGAITCYRRALDLDPNLQPAWDALGQLLLQRRDHAGATDALRRSASVQPTAANFISLGRSLGSFDQYDGALDAFRQAVRLAPESGDAHRWLAPRSGGAACSTTPSARFAARSASTRPTTSLTVTCCTRCCSTAGSRRSRSSPSM